VVSPANGVLGKHSSPLNATKSPVAGIVGLKQRPKNLYPSGPKKIGAPNLVSQALRGLKPPANVICRRRLESRLAPRSTLLLAERSELTPKRASSFQSSPRKLLRKQQSTDSSCVSLLGALIYKVHSFISTITGRVEHVKNVPFACTRR